MLGLAVNFCGVSLSTWALEKDPMQPLIWKTPAVSITPTLEAVVVKTPISTAKIENKADVNVVSKPKIQALKKPDSATIKPTPHTPKKKPLLLEAISVIGQSKTAIISGREYKEGDSIGQYELKEIEFDQVQLSYFLASDVKSQHANMKERIKILNLHDDIGGIFINPVEN
jgi:hypothetical protein